MELLNIDFNLTINDISKYHDEWCKERFGDSDNAKFFEQSPDGRYIYPCVKTGEKLAEEYAIRNRFLELLLRIKKANDKLNNVGQTWPLEYGEREAIKKERQELYSELLQIDKRARGDYSNNNLPDELNNDKVAADYEEECLQAENSTQTRGRGRPNKPFKDMMINDTNGEKLQKLHAIMKDKRGKGAALIILAAVKKGWLQKPTYPQVAGEFGDIGAQQGFTAYLHEEKFTKDEIEGTIKSLD